MGRGKGIQRFICKKCRKSFQLHYKNNACKVGVKEQIAELTVNGCGVRSIARTLGINKNTVVSQLKKQTPHVNPYVIDMIEHNQLQRLDVQLYYTAEMDEFWSYVGKKSNQRWTWYAMDKSSGIIVAWHNGTRADEDVLQLLNYLESIPIDLYYSDAWPAYSRKMPEERHSIGKAYTWKIERKNLNVRTHIKRLVMS